MLKYLRLLYQGYIGTSITEVFAIWRARHQQQYIFQTAKNMTFLQVYIKLKFLAGGKHTHTHAHTHSVV